MRANPLVNQMGSFFNNRHPWQLQLPRRTLTRREGLDRRSACDQGSRQSTKKGVSMYRATAPCKRRRTSHPQPTKRTCKLIEYRGLHACIHLHVHDAVHPWSNKATIITRSTLIQPRQADQEDNRKIQSSKPGRPTIRSTRPCRLLWMVMIFQPAC